MKHISYLGSTIVFVCVLGGVIEGWMSMGAFWHGVFGMGIGVCTLIFTAGIFWTKLHAGWVIDHAVGPVKRVASPRRAKGTDEKAAD